MKKMLDDTHGATMVEYGIMLALIALVCIVVVAALGTSTGRQYSSFNSISAGV